MPIEQRIWSWEKIFAKSKKIHDIPCSRPFRPFRVISQPYPVIYQVLVG